MRTIDDLFHTVIAAIPPSLPSGSWYLIAASALIACGKPEELTSLYVYAVSSGSPLTAAEKRTFSTRLQDVLAKAWTIVGIPPVVVASAALAKVEKKESYETNDGLPKKWEPPQLTPETTSRGTAFMNRLYQENLDPLFATLGFNAPLVEWINRTVVYGLFLADQSILSDVEAELVILSCIMCQGHKAPTLWHLRGLRRLGVNEEDVEKVQTAVKLVAESLGKSTEDWPSVHDVKDEV